MTRYTDGRRALIDQLRVFAPFNEQEEKDLALILSCLENSENIFTRENTLAHMTASAWVLNPAHTRVLMAYHNIYRSWSWVGGHADGESDLAAVALREAREETGIEHIRPVTPKIYSLEILPVNAHVKRGRFVSAHLHLNVTYLLEADDSQALHSKPDENSAVAWLSLEKAAENKEEPFMAVIYRKLNGRIP